MLGAASSLVDCASPEELEEATCDLIGRHWQRRFAVHDRGFREQEWRKALIDAAAGRAAQPGVRRLLYGIAAIATPGLANVALQSLRGVRADGEEPAWLQAPPTVTAEPDVLLLRDVYGLRFGVLAKITGPGGLTRTYLYDVDRCHGHPEVLTSGYFPDVATATAAWRHLVGVSAASAVPEPATDELLPHVLPTGGLIDGLVGQPLTDGQFHEVFRGDRLVFVITHALKVAGRPLHRLVRDQKRDDALVADLIGRFRAWATTAGVDLPQVTGPDDSDIVLWLLHDWVDPDTPEDLVLACSPHRIAAFTAYVVDDWTSEYRSLALALLEPWARFCLEYGKVTGEAAEQTLAWARRVADDPEAIGGDLGHYLNRPIDETSVTGPALPAHAR